MSEHGSVEELDQRRRQLGLHLKRREQKRLWFSCERCPFRLIATVQPSPLADSPSTYLLYAKGDGHAAGCTSGKSHLRARGFHPLKPEKGHPSSGQWKARSPKDTHLELLKSVKSLEEAEAIRREMGFQFERRSADGTRWYYRCRHSDRFLCNAYVIVESRVVARLRTQREHNTNEERVSFLIYLMGEHTKHPAANSSNKWKRACGGSAVRFTYIGELTSSEEMLAFRRNHRLASRHGHSYLCALVEGCEYEVKLKFTDRDNGQAELYARGEHNHELG